MLYYGYPKSINSVGTINGAIDIYKQYDLVVFGDGLELPAHPAHADTVAIFSGLKTAKPNIQLFGYIQIGMDGSTGSDLTMAEMEALVDQWETTGATGIFLDEFGYDYLVTRERQNEIITYCHNKGMNIIANSWEIDYVFGNKSLPLSWRDNFDGNPTNIEPVIGPNDYYMFENMFFVCFPLPDQKVSVPRKVRQAIRYYQEIQPGYNKTFYEQYGSKTIALDGIMHDHPENQYMFNRGYLASLLLNISAYASSTESWSNSNYIHYTQSFGLTRNTLVTVTDHQMNDIFEGKLSDGNEIKLVWKADATTPSLYSGGYHLAYINQQLVTAGSVDPIIEMQAPSLTGDTPIVSNGMVFYYNSKQGLAGNLWTDLSPNGYNLNMTSVTAETDGALFNGTNSKGQIVSGKTLPTMSGEFTVEFAVKIPTYTNSRYFLYGYVGSGQSRAISFNSSRIMRVNDGTGHTITTVTIPTDTLTYIALKTVGDLSARQFAVYVNGVYHSTYTTNSQNMGGFYGQLLLGTDDASYFPGYIPFIRQYNRALTDAELQRNYAVGVEVGMNAASVVRRTKFHDGTDWKTVKPRKYINGLWQEIPVRYHDGVDWKM